MNEQKARTPADVRETLAYRTDAFFIAHLPVALFLALLGLSVLAFSEGAETGHFLAAWTLILVALAWIAYAFYRRAHPSKPVIELSPLGLMLRLPGLEEVRVPWREISAVETVSGRFFFPSLVRPRFIGYRGVTAVRVSRAFYDRKFHVASVFRRGPGWRHTFFPEAKTARIALHHDALDVTGHELRRAVEARWRAFGPEAGEPETARDEEPARGTIRHDHDERTSAGFDFARAWYGAKIVLLSAGIVAMLGNILGYWETDAQQKARAHHAYWQEQYRKWDEEEKQAAEERRKRDKEWEEFWRKNRF